MYAERSYFKTVREIALERKCADLERALMRQKYGPDENYAIMPETHEYVREGAAPPYLTVRLPQVASIRTYADANMPTHLMVAARVLVPEPFGLNYYCNAGLLTDNRIAAQVLALNHERFVRQLAEFVQMDDDKAAQREGRKA